MRSIDSSLLSKINQQNQTIYNNAQPKMSVIVSRAKSSIRDSSYFTIEKIRQKEGVSDVAVSARRRKPIGPPDRIYEIHIDNGMAKTSIREYPDKLKQGFQPQFNVEPAVGVSIVFDGRWHMNAKKRWGLATDELPWIFWIDTLGVLKGRIWDTGEAYAIAENVTNLDTLRGWIPAQAGHTDDQGIIVAYIKNDGKIYYRNYCMQSTGIFIWETEKEITTFGSGCLGVRLFRTNDFRTGFIAEKATGNIMAITQRNWAGMSIPAESLVARLSAEIDLVEMEKMDLIPTDEHLTAKIDANAYLCPINMVEIAPLAIKRSNPTELLIEFGVELYNINSIKGFEVKNGTGIINYEIDEINFNDNTKELKIKLINEMDAKTTIKVIYTSNIDNVLVIDNQCCKLELPSFELTSEGALQDGHLTEYLIANINTVITMTRVEYLSGYSANEHLTAGINANIKLWGIDDAPI